MIKMAVSREAQTLQPAVEQGVSKAERRRSREKSSVIIPSTEAYIPRPKKVLIIEDDLCLKTVLLSIFRKIDSKITCTWATSGESALSKLTENRYDLIVCDHELETSTTGMDIWRNVRTVYPPTSFLLMSGMGVPRFLKMTEAFDRPPLYLPKPFKITECHQYFNTLLKGGFDV